MDIANVVAGFKGEFSAILTLEATDLTGPDCEPNQDANFNDIATVVNAFKGESSLCAAPCAL